MLLLLTEPAFTRFGDAIGAVAPDARFIRMQKGGDLLFGDRPLPWEEAAPDIAWVTSDLFDDGPVRPFFKLLLTAKPGWVQIAGAGVDHPVFGMILSEGVRLTTSHVTGGPIAEYVMRAVLDHYQQPALWSSERAERRWVAHDFRELHGTTWLVIGLGAIGTAVAERARAFGATVIGVRRRPDGTEPVDECVRPDRLEAVLPRADVVVLSAPGGAETRHLMHRGTFGVMRPRSVLVNVGRGSLVDEDALHDALDRGTPEVAILDVTEVEPPPPDSWLWSHPRVVLTPHSSAGGTGRYARSADVFCENLKRWLNGEPLHHEVTAGSTP
jgi:phosphoglycerate dehydrogenase-like enzyme